MMRAGILAVTLLVFGSADAAAEWQIRPFLGVTFGGETTFIDAAQAAGSLNVVVGVNGALLGDMFGVEADFSRAPGFFRSGDQNLVQGNAVTTLTGNAIISMPRRLTEFTLGPYFVFGGGLMHVHIDQFLDVLSVARTLPALDVGGGVTGNLSRRFGLNWDARYFWSVGGDELHGVSVAPEELSFWRAIMAIVIRY
ncbi:MAG TPA: hypothetical protein VM818_14230 [Vicinamibacterales bacterium]|nr:hypothetical protein [Vicinamibacterales bacterium]